MNFFTASRRKSSKGPSHRKEEKVSKKKDNVIDLPESLKAQKMLKKLVWN
ncbi:MAG: hypothetical protein QXX95_02180 [Nitrososphaerales archaeon]